MRPNEFTEEFVRARHAAGLSQNALARKAGLTSMFLSDLELGRRMPSLDVTAKLTRALGIESSQLLRLHPEESIKRIVAVARKRPDIAILFARLARRIVANEVPLNAVRLLAGKPEGYIRHG